MRYREIEAITSLSHQSDTNYTSQAVTTLSYSLKKSAARAHETVHRALINTFSIRLSFCSIFSLFSLRSRVSPLSLTVDRGCTRQNRNFWKKVSTNSFPIRLFI